MDKCSACRAPVGYTADGDMRFDSSRYHMDAVKKLSEISAWKGEAERLRKALEAVLDRYVSLVNCGDCGSWDPEKESEVIAARGALSD